MLLRFIVGPVAFTGDLRQFYCSIGLCPSQWNLQRCLWKENLDINSETIELVIVSLIFGIRSVSGLSERAVLDLANHVSKSFPRLAEVLVSSRFVDDLGDSEKTKEIVKELINGADELFESVGLQCKGWSVSGSPPHPDVTHDNISVDVAGMRWWPEIDTLCVKIPSLHFGKKSRGRWGNSR